MSGYVERPASAGLVNENLVSGAIEVTRAEHAQ